MVFLGAFLDVLRLEAFLCGVQHRYVEEHACTFNYIEHERKQLAEANQRVVGAKVDKL